MELPAGALLAGRFRVRAPRAVGGVSTVYLGIDEAGGAAVAIKVLGRDWAGDRSVRQRFLAEVALVRELGVALGAAFRGEGTSDGCPFLVLEFVDGPTLRERRSARGPMAPEAARRVAARLLRRLDALHAKGIAHLDVKAAHVMADGDVLLDLGSALPVGAPFEPVGISPACAAPEQWREGAVADPRIDVYAAGALLFEMIAGRRPFRIDPAEPLASFARRGPPDLEQLGLQADEGLARVVATALAPDPSDRFADASELAAALAGLAEEAEHR